MRFFCFIFFFVYVKVPSFPDDLAMALIEEELGKPWHEVYSELSPSPIAAGKFLTCYSYALLVILLDLVPDDLPLFCF